MTTSFMNISTHNLGQSESCFFFKDTPFYYSDRSSLLSRISDHHLALASPVVAYWGLSLFFHALDVSGWRWLDKYRIHESYEVRSRNRVSQATVVWAVILQHLIQTTIGLYWLSEDPKSVGANHRENMESMAQTLAASASLIFGHRAHNRALELQCSPAMYYLYWWGIPILQFFFAMFFIDTWQYFLHRLMHMNQFLFKHLHSVHHRLYVPYSFGALYNHPVEGFLLDTLGSVIAQSVSFMSTRQAILLFTFATFKTVDDHCGYAFPFDPLQRISGNNADYHDIHHQIIGLKYNYSQPFFVHWDALLGTRMTREEVVRRKAAHREKAL